MKVNNMSYRQWQKRNTEAFQKLTKAQQKKARDRGYRNVGWQKVQTSWEILQQFQTPSLFDARLKRGDIAGAIDQSILEADQAKNVPAPTLSLLSVPTEPPSTNTPLD